VNTSGASGVIPELVIKHNHTNRTPDICPELSVDDPDQDCQAQAAATGAADLFTGTAVFCRGSLCSAATATGQTLTWTGATGGRAYTGVTIAAFADAATSSLANQTLQSAFDPKTIPGCVLWLDAADSTTVTTATASTATVRR